MVSLLPKPLVDVFDAISPLLDKKRRPLQALKLKKETLLKMGKSISRIAIFAISWFAGGGGLSSGAVAGTLSLPSGIIFLGCFLLKKGILQVISCRSFFYLAKGLTLTFLGYFFILTSVFFKM